MLKGKASSSYSWLAAGSKVECSDFPAGTQAWCHPHWDPYTAPSIPTFPRETCRIPSGGNHYHLLSDTPSLQAHSSPLPQKQRTGGWRAASSLPPQEHVPLQLLPSDKKHVGFLSRAAADPRRQGFLLEPHGEAAGGGHGLTPGAARGRANRGEDGGAMPQARPQRMLGRRAWEQTGGGLLMQALDAERNAAFGDLTLLRLIPTTRGWFVFVGILRLSDRETEKKPLFFGGDDEARHPAGSEGNVGGEGRSKTCYQAL